MSIKKAIFFQSNNVFGGAGNLQDDALASYVQQFSYCSADFYTAFKLVSFRLAVNSAAALTAAYTYKLQGSNNTTTGDDGTWTDITTFNASNLGTPSAYPGWCNEIVVNFETAFRFYRLTGANNVNTIYNGWELISDDTEAIIDYPFWDRYGRYWQTQSNGKRVNYSGTGVWLPAESTFSPAAGSDFYFEVVLGYTSGGNTIIGLTRSSLVGGTFPGSTVNSWGYHGGGQKFNNQSGINYGNSYTAGNRIGVLFLDGCIYFWKSGSGWQGANDGGSPVGKAAAYSGITEKVWPAVGAYNSGTYYVSCFVASEIENTTVPAGVQIGTGGEPPPPSEYIYADLAQLYSINIGDILAFILVQQYGIASTLAINLDQLYSILLEIWLSQIYGDVPALAAILTQPYKSAPIIETNLDQPWSDALQLAVSLHQPWQMSLPLDAECSQRYGIVAEVLHKTAEQLYNINDLTTLFADLYQPYALAAAAAMISHFDVTLTVGGERIPFISLEWQAVESEYAWTCSFSVKTKDLALRCVPGAEIIISASGDTLLLKCYDGWLEDKRFGQTLYRVDGCSRTKDLDLATPLLGGLPAGMASQLVADLAAPLGISVDWQMADGFLAAGLVQENNESPLTVIKNIVHDAGGIVLSTVDGNLLIVAEEETPVPEWSAVVPAETIIAPLERISTSEQADTQNGYNLFRVSDQTAAGGQFNLEYQAVDAFTRECRLFIVPLEGRTFTLISSGGSEVTIEPCGVMTLPMVDELVEFVGGSGRCQKPLYGISAMAWQRDNLGAIESTEEGLLTAAIAGESLLKISYLSRYHKWLIRDNNIESVQCIALEVEE